MDGKAEKGTWTIGSNSSTATAAKCRGYVKSVPPNFKSRVVDAPASLISCDLWKTGCVNDTTGRRFVRRDAGLVQDQLGRLQLQNVKCKNKRQFHNNI